MIQKTSRELHSLYNRFTREAALEDLSKDLTDLNKVGNAITQDFKSMENDFLPGSHLHSSTTSS
jgi:hypothetical protein